MMRARRTRRSRSSAKRSMRASTAARRDRNGGSSAGRWPGARGGVADPGSVAAKEDLVLGSEVAEEGAGRDVAGGGDLLDRGVVETLALEEVEGGVLERPARLLLLSLPEPRRGVDDRGVHGTRSMKDSLPVAQGVE